MSFLNPHNHSPLSLAAQADLVMVTVEMLRSPQSIQTSRMEPWFELPFDTFDNLLETALGPLAISLPASQPLSAGHTQDHNQEPSNALECESPSLHKALLEVYELARQLDHEPWSDEFYRMFDSSQACALNQASYIRRDKGTIIGDVCGFYNAFGWRGNLSRGERPDNLRCQLEFVGMALAMAAQATDDQQREVVHQALGEFARLHMHDWMPAVCYHLIDSTYLPYFGAVGQWLMVLWNQLTKLHAWPVDPVSNSPLAPIIDLEDPYECGAPELVQLQVKDIGVR